MDEVRLLPGGAKVIERARAELPQRDDLCGAFAAFVSLRAAGFDVLDQDEAALAAGTVRLVGGPPTVPPGEKGRTDFRLTLPVTEHVSRAGTSGAGVAHAVDRLSGGLLAAVPARGDWTAATLWRLLTATARLDLVALVANVDTALFAAHDTPERALSDYLETGQPPLWMSRWCVGHFVLVTGVLPRAEGILVSIMDTYPTLGTEGVHLQPVEHVAAALRREGSAPGGMLLIVPEEEADAARAAVTGAGLRAELWDTLPES